MKYKLALLCLSFALSSQAAMPDFSAIKNSQEKKRAFFSYLLPRVNEANKIIANERATLLKLQGRKLSTSEQYLVNRIAKRYGMNNIKNNKDMQQLLEKVDVVPASMVLAQAANESAWGTSRFAKQGSNLFGQWCYQKGCGLVPSRRSAGMHHEVRVFKDAKDSIASYMNNLNTNQSYAFFRKLRAQRRQQHQGIQGTQLAQGLVKYSERGQAYVNEIRAMIHTNHLEQFDKSL